MTQLDALTHGRIDARSQLRARLAICRAVLGDLPGPRWRKGSNNEPRSLIVDVLTRSCEPCQVCGAPGEQIVAAVIGNGAREVCLSCNSEAIVGDYDWNSLSDCLRFKADLAAGAVASDAATCPTCLVELHDFAGAEAIATDCARSHCGLKPAEVL
ncbi:hypothetical protein [Sphingomonas montanisoli]|uniref:Uncharacterized protein n=1 Tax=Sphingomonas montanisoli TaxID=2606412 RepID=A0A5D9BZQ8_9SPHN|nr:hypothetical protein [Sphingomonas montanisoli]TZG24896.1 hypothetical protein FYJ91_16585 [Sphingomonas montanisoli]